MCCYIDPTYLFLSWLLLVSAYSAYGDSPWSSYDSGLVLAMQGDLCNYIKGTTLGVLLAVAGPTDLVLYDPTVSCGAYGVGYAGSSSCYIKGNC